VLRDGLTDMVESSVVHNILTAKHADLTKAALNSLISPIRMAAATIFR